MNLRNCKKKESPLFTFVEPRLQLYSFVSVTCFILMNGQHLRASCNVTGHIPACLKLLAGKLTPAFQDMRPSRGVGSPPRIELRLLLVRDGREHELFRNVLHIDALKRSIVFIKFLPLFPNLVERLRQRKLGFRVL